MIPPGQRSRPQADLEAADVSQASNTQCRSPRAQQLARRRAALDLDRLLDCYPYPSPHEMYGVTAALGRLLQDQSAAA
jgi:hypothetical protein